MPLVPGRPPGRAPRNRPLLQDPVWWGSAVVAVVVTGVAWLAGSDTLRDRFGSPALGALYAAVVIFILSVIVGSAGRTLWYARRRR